MGHPLGQPGFCLLFVAWIGVGMEKRNRYSLDLSQDAGCGQHVAHPLQAAGVKGLHNSAKPIQTLRHLEAQGAGHEMVDLRRMQIIDVIAHFALRIEHIAETARCDQDRRCTFAFD